MCIWQHHLGISRSPWHQNVEGREGRADNMGLLEEEGTETVVESLRSAGREEELEVRRSCSEADSASSSFLPSPQPQ